MRYPNPTPAHPGLARDQARHAWRRPQRQGHARTSFPNPEAKTASADGTAPARVWESRTPPPAHHKKKGGARHGPPLFAPTPHKHTAPATQPHRPHTQTQTIRTPAKVRQTAPATQPHTPATQPHTGHTDRPHSRTRKHRAPAHRPKFATPRPILEHRVRASPSPARSRRTQPNTRTQVDAVGYETCV